MLSKFVRLQVLRNWAFIEEEGSQEWKEGQALGRGPGEGEGHWGRGTRDRGAEVRKEYWGQGLWKGAEEGD